MASELVTAQGYRGAFNFKQQTTWDNVPTGDYTRLDYISETFADETKGHYLPGATGFSSQLLTRRRLGLGGASGTVTTGMMTSVWNALLGMIFGESSPASPYGFTETGELPLYFLKINKAKGTNAGDRIHVPNARLAKATLTSSQDDQDLKIALDMIGEKMDVGQSFSDGALPTGLIPQHYECTVTIDGTPVYPKSVELVIDHGTQNDVFRNSRTRIAIPRGLRKVTGRIELDYNDTALAQYANWVANAGVTLTIAWAVNVGGTTHTLTFSSYALGCKFDGETPGTSADNLQTMMNLPFELYASPAGNDELTATYVAA